MEKGKDLHWQTKVSRLKSQSVLLLSQSWIPCIFSLESYMYRERESNTQKKYPKMCEFRTFKGWYHISSFTTCLSMTGGLSRLYIQDHPRISSNQTWFFSIQHLGSVIFPLFPTFSHDFPIVSGVHSHLVSGHRMSSAPGPSGALRSTTGAGAKVAPGRAEATSLQVA